MCRMHFNILPPYHIEDLGSRKETTNKMALDLFNIISIEFTTLVSLSLNNILSMFLVIKFKIKININYNSWIAFGLCDKQIVIKNYYKFNKK